MLLGTTTLGFSSLQSVGVMPRQKRGITDTENQVSALDSSTRHAMIKMRTNVLGAEIKTTCTR